MKASQNILSKIFTKEKLSDQVKQWKLHHKRIVFTNGVFDILHPGHISSLCDAAAYGNVLIVAVNSDASVKRLKGDERPVNNEQSRALLLASLVMTDAVVIFDESTPQQLIASLLPDVLVKGGDYTVEQIAGAKEVMANGGEVKIVPIQEGFSTTSIINKLRS